MFMEERQQEIALLIEVNGKVTISQISEKYKISDESARRDLRFLEKQGLCKRTRGGAIRLSQVNLRPSEDRDFSTMPVFDTYREIAREAAGQIRENDVVYLCGGSFGYIMLSFLPRDIRYTLVVNTVDTGKELRDFENIDVYVVGGRMRKSGSMVDSLARDFINRMHFDLCFLTGGGLTAEFGLSNGTDETASFQRTVLGNSRKKILLMPGSKIGTNAFIKVCEASSFDQIITDWDAVEDQIGALEEAGVIVTIVEEPK